MIDLSTLSPETLATARALVAAQNETFAAVENGKTRKARIAAQPAYSAASCAWLEFFTKIQNGEVK